MHDFEDPTISERTTDDLLDELEVRCQTNVAAVRERPAAAQRVVVDVFAGNACDRDALITSLEATALSAQSMTGLTRSPVMVGSVFHLRFDAGSRLPPTLAVCDRCAMLGDASFELRLRFVNPLDLTDS